MFSITKRSFSQITGTLLLLACGVFCFSFSISSNVEKSPATEVKFVTLKFFKGSVYAYNLEGEQRVLKKEDKVYFGEILRTAADSIAVVKIIQGVKLKVDANSVVEVDNLYSKKMGKQEKKSSRFFPSFFLHRGTLYGDVDKDRKDLQEIKVKTKYVALGVRGTQFFVHQAGNKEAEYTAHVKRGTVELQSGKQKRSVANGKGVHLSPEGELSQATEQDWSKDLNYNFDPAKGVLMTPEKAFANIRKSYEAYAKKVRKKAKSYFDSQKKRFDRMRPRGSKKR
jgi:hypothetical protein